MKSFGNLKYRIVSLFVIYIFMTFNDRIMMNNNEIEIIIMIEKNETFEYRFFALNDLIEKW